MSIRVSRPTGVKWRRDRFASLVARDGAVCAKCGVGHMIVWRKNGQCSSSPYGEWPHTITYPTSNLEIDHITPLSEGGDNEMENLWLLCRDCHKAKTSRERSNRLKSLFAAARQ